MTSEPVLPEIDIALSHQDDTGERVLFPVTIDDCLFEKWRHRRRSEFLKLVVGDFRGATKNGDEFNDRLKSVLKGLTKPE